MKKTSDELIKIVENNYGQPFFIGYNMLIESLKHKNIINGLSDSLSLAQLYLESDDVLIYIKDSNNKYKILKNSRISKNMNENDIYDNIVNEINVDEIKYYKEYCFYDGKIDSISIVPIKSDKSQIIVIPNSKKEKNQEYNKFISILKDTFETLIDKISNYNHMKEQTEIDALTGLKNRQAYNSDISKIKENEKITFTILDLFRLKYINDNINHYTGDCYIRKTAEILREFFPKTLNINGIEIQTGDEIYRVGGDEFIIISKNKSENLIEIIMEYVTLKIEEMKLNVGSDVVKGINYGTVSRRGNESIEQLYKEADKKMSNDKQETYKKYGLNRRR